MGNCFALCKPASRIHSCTGAVPCKDRGVVQIMKMDGKIVEFAAPILVKNALVQFSGLNVGLSREASQYLPSDYELKLGNMYHFLPNSSSACAVQNLGLAEGETPATRIEKEQGGSVKRIKVVITKQQLQDLLAKQTLKVGTCCTQPQDTHTSLNIHVDDLALYFGLGNGDEKHSILQLRLDVVLVTVIRELQAGIVVGTGVAPVPSPVVPAFVLLLLVYFDNEHVILHPDLHVFLGAAGHVEPHLDLVLFFSEVPRGAHLPSWEGHGVLEYLVDRVQHLTHCPHW
ncbi:hypothetical protein RJ640_028307 [Escallonia rubra]|uniref:Uncharacterized protein n=1 Tax=Escallonia rubra TaxID=112253 RepID=A0AA88RTE6_9ASTE|nr:hypothetical protein RJ640_028307 [Escallonia rubra]